MVGEKNEIYSGFGPLLVGPSGYNKAMKVKDPFGPTNKQERRDWRVADRKWTAQTRENVRRIYKQKLKQSEGKR